MLGHALTCRMVALRGAHREGIRAAARVGTAGRVVAFEPTPDTVRKLARNLALNGLEYELVHQLRRGAGARTPRPRLGILL